MKNDKPAKESDFLLYTSREGEVNVEVLLKDYTVWLTQKSIGELFGKERSVIPKHLNNIFASGELDAKSKENSHGTDQLETCAGWQNIKIRCACCQKLSYEAHISELNQIVSAYLDLAENRAKRQILTKMVEWIVFLHNFKDINHE